MSTERQKIVILGGGVSSLATAFYLTLQSDWQEKYDITLYQIGWRLGGHGASGRDEYNRILEHGLHVWFGCYNNAFRLMWHCYEALNRPATAPLATFDQAFVPQHYAVYPEYIDGEWRMWGIDFPSNDKNPGMPEFPDDPQSLPEPLDAWDYFQVLMEFIEAKIQDSVLAEFLQDWQINSNQFPAWWKVFLERVELNLSDPTRNIFLQLIHHLMQTLTHKRTRPNASDYQILVWLLRQVKLRVEERVNPYLIENDALRHAWLLLDLGLTTLIGMLVDGVVVNGFNPLDRYDLREWLAKHGAGQYAVDSSVIRAIYDSFFAYEEGDRNRPDFAAGSALACILRVMFDYRGAVMYKMAAGTGDTIIAPLYQVLKERGVKFKFFHRVDQLELDATGTSIARIQLGQQMEIKNGADYAPLVDFNGLPVWTEQPLYGQLVRGEELQASGENLEMAWNQWDDAGALRLEVGQDFDTVILGLSYGVLPKICAELVAANQQWEKCLKNVKTVQTQAVQLWFKNSLGDLGWQHPAPMISGYAKDFSSWAEFSQLLPWEGQPFPTQSVFYASDVLPDVPPDSLNASQQITQTNQVEANLKSYLTASGDFLWSKVASKEQFDWNSLAAPDSSQARGRLSSQYWRANINPAERFVLSPSGGNQYRIKPTQTGFTNLYAVGAWTYNWWYNIACMEVAITSGMQVARAIGGYPQGIIGETEQTS